MSPPTPPYPDLAKARKAIAQPDNRFAKIIWLISNWTREDFSQPLRAVARASAGSFLP